MRSRRKHVTKRALCGMAALSLALLAPGLVAAEGLLVESVAADGAAARAGVQGGDVIVDLDGHAIGTLPDLQAVLEAHQAGDALPLIVSRQGEHVSLRLTLGGEAGERPRLGVMLSLTPETAFDRERAISREERREILGKIAAELRRGYLYEEKGNALAAQVETAATGERFAAADTLEAFVTSVNDFLLAIGNDKHLRLRFGPPVDEAGDHPPQIRRGGPGGDNDFGVREARLLPGNIGYLDLRMFAGTEAAKASIDAGMMTLAGADALIIDLGQNGGGGPWMVRYLSGFLFAEPTHLTDTWMRGMEAPRERWTLDGQPTDAFVDKPVYILTSSRTFSAAESFTFGLVINDRVTLVGERTGGGGHFGDEISVSPELRIFMPGGRTYDPETGKGWEAEGIAPDIEVPYDEARERAMEAIRRAGSKQRALSPPNPGAAPELFRADPVPTPSD